MDSPSLRKFHELHIQGVKPGELVSPEVYLIGYLTNEVVAVLDMLTAKVHIRSIALKHIYEKRNAYEYDIILDHLHEIIRYPDRAYRNINIKSADFIFVKEIEQALYASALKSNAHPEIGQQVTIIVSAFKTNEQYLQKFELIQCWKGGTPSS